MSCIFFGYVVWYCWINCCDWGGLVKVVLWDWCDVVFLIGCFCINVLIWGRFVGRIDVNMCVLEMKVVNEINLFEVMFEFVFCLIFWNFVFCFFVGGECILYGFKFFLRNLFLLRYVILLFVINFLVIVVFLVFFFMFSIGFLLLMYVWF